MMIEIRNSRGTCRASWLKYVLGVLTLLVLSAGLAFAQADQGAITGTVTDSSGAAVPNAQVALTAVDTGLVLQTKSDSAGNYLFTPVKIGNYTITAEAPGFSKTTQTRVHLDVQQRLAVSLTLKPGVITETITVDTAPPLLQTEEASTGQVMDTKTVNNTPLNGRNWVFIAQLTTGVAPPSGSRGAGKGDFNANGQRAEQNNFILDGVDNNNNVVDFLNGASFVVRPPPDALAEFKIQTGAYNAEFGHSAGAVVNASIKSGTNAVHGNLWEYVRNTAFDIHDRFAGTVPVPNYQQNQFGATLGLPIIRNKLFFFGDFEANRVLFGAAGQTFTVPTLKMRTGDFSELLTATNNAGGQPIQLYEPNATNNGATPIAGNRIDLDPNLTMDPVAQAILNLYPTPNLGSASQTHDNLTAAPHVTDNTFQWDARMDYNLSSSDQMFARYSYSHEPQFRAGPLGSPLDGGDFGSTGNIFSLGQNFAFSETHLFSQGLANELRFGHNYGHFGFHQINADTNVAQQLGLGGVPFGPLNGGLPLVNISGYRRFGTPQFYVSDEHLNVFEILDNVSKNIGRHALRTGVSFQKIRFATEQPTNPRGNYNFTGQYTSQVGTANTGFGGADFLLNQMNNAGISNLFTTNDARWDRAVYFQDDWKFNRKLTVNLGLRYEFAQPYYEMGGHQALFSPTSLATGAGTGVYLIPSQSQNVPLSSVFTNLLAANNVTVQYSKNPSLVESQKTNFAPRIGFAYQTTDKSVVRAGFGIFYGGLESTGYFPNLGENYPFEFDSTFPAPSCTAGGACPNVGITLENGFTNAINAGLQNSISTPALRSGDRQVHTPYSEQYNLSYEYAISNHISAQAGYVGSRSRNLQVFPNPNAAQALAKSGTNTNFLQAFPGFGGLTYTAYAGISNYNSLQAKLEQRFNNGLSYLVSYTWAHSLDDAPTPLGSTGDAGYRNTEIVPIRSDYARSPFDIRQRLTYNLNYQLPFGKSRSYMNGTSKWLDYVIGGWSTSMLFRAQTGPPFTVNASGITSPAGAGTRAILASDPFKGGGTPDVAFSCSNPANATNSACIANPTGYTFTCPTAVRTVQNWYNPCAFRNPTPDNLAVGQTVSGSAALAYLGGTRNQIAGPGYLRIDQSLFKAFHTYREQELEFRADVFNLLNTPAYANPSDVGISGTGGLITGSRSLQANTPDSRFFQFSLKYSF